ncbi:MAG: hypothetical protein JNK76_12130 [Planctomycetales bacterium]|nr:hypothetical protein [Planctomycetales bacterium]
MELFSVACITCNARIKVRSTSAVGQILACPRCGGMVQIEPPAGWKPPPEGTAPKSPAAAAKRAPQASSDVPGEPPVYTAEPVADDLAAPTLVSPHEQRTRRIIYLVGGLAAAAVAGFGLWAGSGDNGPPEEAADQPIAKIVATATPSASATKPKPAATHTAPTATAVKPPAIATATAGATAPKAVASPTASASPTRPSILALADAAPTPSGTAVAMASFPAVPAPPVAQPPKPVATAPAVAPPPEIAAVVDTSSRLDRPAGGLRFAGVSRKAALEVVAQLAGLSLDVDWDALAPADVGLADKLDLSAADGDTLRTILEQLLAPKKLRWSAAGSALVVRASADADAPTNLTYAVADLTAGDAAQTAALGAMVQLLVVPQSWSSQGGAVTLTAGSDTLVVSQTPAAQREIAELLDRLRVARGKSPLMAGTSLQTRFAAARSLLEAPVTMNFRPAAPLRTVLGKLEAETGALITVDVSALAAEGASPETLVGIAADKHPLAVVLTALCDPRGWAWRIIDPRTIEITTRDALRRRAYVELYDVRLLLADGSRPEPLIARLKQQTAEAGWLESGGHGAIVFDAAASALIVRQHQAGHQRLAQLLAEALAAQTPAPAASTPRPTATPPAAASPSGTAPRPTGTKP